MDISGSHEGLQQKRRSLEEKAKTLVEKARLEKIAIDKKLAMEILEEENRTHNDAVKELEERIANLEQQLKTSPAENASTETSSERVEEITEADEDISAGVLPPPEQDEVEVTQEGSRKKKRNLF